LKRKHSPPNEVTSSHASTSKINDASSHIEIQQQFDNPDNVLLVEDDEGKIFGVILV
jgi:hypothetical protein